jgi:hypothetical protein
VDPQAALSARSHDLPQVGGGGRPRVEGDPGVTDLDDDWARLLAEAEDDVAGDVPVGIAADVDADLDHGQFEPEKILAVEKARPEVRPQELPDPADLG